MVKILRRKFVIVTTTMMLCLFCVLWIIDKMNSEYWYTQDSLSLLNLITDSYILPQNSDHTNTATVEELTADNPITSIVINNNGEIISRQILGGSAKKETIPNAILKRITDSSASEYRIGKYIFTRRVLDPDKTLIVIINTAESSSPMIKLLAYLLFACVGLSLLVLITFYLSRFVTVPAQEAIVREKRFISDASHELKTPLSAISINAQALELNGADSIHVKNIISESQRMNRLIEKLLSLARIEENEDPVFEVFSLSDVVQEMLLTYESTAFEVGKDIDYEIDEGLTLNGNEDEIRQLIAILLDNAIKNSDGLNPIVFTCKNIKKTIHISVTNTGKEIAQSDIEHIFERFYTTDRLGTSGSFGLGLAIAKAIVDRHNGTINVKSDSISTVFTVVL